jgi:hypothetical protein
MLIEIWNIERNKLWNALNDAKYHLYSNWKQCPVDLAQTRIKPSSAKTD